MKAPTSVVRMWNRVSLLQLHKEAERTTHTTYVAVARGGEQTDKLKLSLRPQAKHPKREDHLRSGCLAAGPLLFPGRPLMFEVSCCWMVEFDCLSVEEPTVPPGLAAGPFLLPGCPAIPAPELCALGAAETSGFVVCADAV